MNMTYISVENTNQDTGEALSIAHSTEYRNTTPEGDQYYLTIIEGTGEDITLESAEIVTALAESGYPSDGWVLA